MANAKERAARSRHVLASAVVAFLLLTPVTGETSDTAPGSSQSMADTGAALEVFCSIAPQRYLIERVGGDLVGVGVLVGPGQSPHTFEPTPRQMAGLADARVYFTIGLPFEDRILGSVEELNAELLLVDTSEGIPRRHVEGAHGHDESGEHGDSCGLTDPHVWLNPRFAGRLAGSVCDALKDIDPDHTEEFEGNLAALMRDLDELDKELTAALAPLSGESVYVFHPAFGYFTDAYGLKQVAVELGGMEPRARELVRLIERATEERVRVIFVQPQFSSRSAGAIAAEIGGVVVPIDPLSGDYLQNLRSIAREIQGALGGE